jgi:hypothetical protein
MAKIALVTQRLTPEALGLARALKFHRHEIILITSVNEEVPDDLDFQVLTFFKKWSAFEALRFFPRILGQAPEVWHFVYSNSQLDRPTPAQWVLAQLIRALPGRVVATSFYDSLFHISAARLMPFLKSCDIVTTATRENLMYIKRRSWLQRHCETEVLPPFVIPNATEPEHVIDEDLQHLIQAASPYLVLPCERLPTGPHLDWGPILSKVQILICGSRPERSLEGVFYIGRHLPVGHLQEILSHSRGLLIAFEDLSVVELLNYQRMCSQTRTPVLATARQAEALPGLCVNKRNGFLIENLSQLNHLLMENPKLEIHSPLFESVKTDLADSALNELNRMYSKVRHLKTSQVDFKRGPLP